ncbi:unnamed protein product [Notodromas monacha]|uniref:Uncharacterized protein n=1 Tax=Notodromas monacha TaxID=399045 RepID=A0A7R9GDQ7_9CRUS|nr:unnamed protein product [Notodromas monacha]CAG0917135.1 unnamed protein product [Notodromas monacha]
MSGINVSMPESSVGGCSAGGWASSKPGVSVPASSSPRGTAGLNAKGSNEARRALESVGSGERKKKECFFAMASVVNWLDSRAFFEQANSAQFEYVLSRYKEALQHKSETKRKPAELQKLDAWFQEELPRIMKKRKPDMFFTHDELVQAIKWKLARGKFRPKLKELVQMNTPRQHYNLSVLSVMAPEKVAFMADECLLAINKGEALDYSMNEFMQYLENVEKLCERLNAEELPRIMKKRKPDMFFTHDELVQAIKWKLARGKFRPKLKELVQMNTPRVVMLETKKACRQLGKQNIKSAILALSNLKGIGPAFASAVLSVMAPEKVAFMADECLLAINKGEALDYSMNEFMQYLENVEKLCERLNAENPDFWTPHKVELAIWSHYVLSEMNPDSLDSIETLTAGNTVLPAEVTESTHDDKEPKKVSEDEDSRGSHQEHIVSSGDDELSRDSAGKVDSPRVTECHHENGDASNDSGVKMMQDVAAVDYSCNSSPSLDEPQAKKIRLETTTTTSDEKLV